MSRFFATGSDSESDTSSEEEQIQRAPAAAFTFSDDEEDTKRVVRSAKEKRYEEIKNAIKLIGNQKKIKDINPMLNTFEELVKAYNKAAPVIASVENGKTPTFYLRCLVELDDFIKEVWNDTDGRKSMSKTNSKALSTLRQKLRKYIKEKDFEKEIEAFRENPPKDDDDEEEIVEEADSDDDDNDQVNDFKKQEPIPDVAKFKKGAEDDSDSDSDWGSSSDDESSSSSDDDKPHAADYFRKTQKDGGDDEQKQVKKDHRKDRKEKDRKKKREEDDGEGEWETVKGGVAIPSEKPKMFAKDAEINNAAVLKKLNEIIAARGKKRTDRRGQIELLHELQAIAENHNLTAPLVKIKFSIISSIFDYNPKVSDAMKTEYWSKILERIMEMLTLLLSTNDITLSKSIPEDEEEYENAPFKIHGCVLTLVERLDEEFIKLLKECDPHSNEYVERLKDENQVCTIIDKVEEYLERQGVPSELCRIYIRKIEHLYYKCDPTVFKQKEGEIPADASTSVKVMDKMCKYIYSHDETDRLRTRAILSHIYHHAIHDNWFKARDLFLMSHLQDNIHHSDPATQILYNRAVANLGLCAFRHANIKDAHNCLLDLMMTGRVKELLAQGFMPQRQHERNKEQEKIEKQRQMPFHMHINLEVLECVYLVSAMLIEIPYMAAHEFDARKRMISKTYYQQLRSSERQSLVGPPESMREHVVAASKAMRNGNWAACNNFIINEKMNGKVSLNYIEKLFINFLPKWFYLNHLNFQVWDLFNQADKVRAMLTKLIKEEALRTYLFTYSHVYDSLSMPTLALMFELERSTVHSIISKMIINEELMASLDEPSETVVMHRSEPSRLQSMALQLTDKVNNFVDSNERIFEMKQGNFRNQGNFRERFNRQDGGGRQRRDRRNDERNKY
uniref:Eukaryotic translation initiation factor 3 subunit C n=1 Tax=Trichogramma kaykai TaxID=54128 RepID=A0ABD2XHE3_9HYME